jgi:hypothetical protein
MITHDTRRSLSRGNNPVPSPWQATWGIAALIVAILAVLDQGGFLLAGLVGSDQTDNLGDTVHVNFTPHLGIFVAILGCVAAGIGAIMSLRRR